MRQWNWTTKAAAELVQAELVLWLVLVVVLEVCGVETFIAVLPESAAMLVIGSTTRCETNTNRAVTRTLSTWSSR